ncbi:hypothetical protein D9758_015867 [Tetrapyrgos nigripes]|uniref:Hydrophobin n=1 Tax=Tetrapyrgos nigripes TaxID=182062 RepID=A0A8H5CJM6_9AGAR|nr:hypothetical protein D9758_015867 [Tetrapyrgos nigripes]
MKFSSVFTLVLAAAAATAAPQPQRETNAERFARGLSPLPPVRRDGTTVAQARGAAPSPPPPPPPPPPGQCNTGNTLCCKRTSTAGLEGLLLGLLGIIGIHPDTKVGVTCSPLSIIGIGGNSCTQQPVCCDKNWFNGAIATGCNPININL